MSHQASPVGAGSFFADTSVKAWDVLLGGKVACDHYTPALPDCDESLETIRIHYDIVSIADDATA